MLFRHLENKLTVVTVLFTLKNMNPALYIALFSRKKGHIQASPAGGRYVLTSSLPNPQLLIKSFSSYVLTRSTIVA
jgi:hypothetical protein